VNELPALPLFYPVYTYAVDAQVRGARIGPLFDPSDRFLTINDWYLVARGKIAEAATKTSSP
jgi:peptide/nickel transport system substrate-binding protein